MGRDMQVSDSVVIDVDPVTLYEQVADPTQMPRWSPENTGARTGVEAGPLRWARSSTAPTSAAASAGPPSAW